MLIELETLTDDHRALLKAAVGNGGSLSLFRRLEDSTARSGRRSAPDNSAEAIRQVVEARLPGPTRRG